MMGATAKPSDKELGAYAQEVLRRRRASRALRESTLATYERYVRDDITPSKLGGMRLTEIRRTDVNGFLADLSDAGRGATTVRRILAVLQMVLSAAVRDELIGANPALGAERPAQPDATIKIWDLKTIGEFMRRASSHRLSALYELAIYCGLRRGELAALRWQDVDLANRELIVGRNRTTIDGKIVETMTPKTKSGHHTVPLTDAAVAALLTWKLRQDQEAEDAKEAWHTEGHVFTMEDGRGARSELDHSDVREDLPAGRTAPRAAFPRSPSHIRQPGNRRGQRPQHRRQAARPFERPGHWRHLPPPDRRRWAKGCGRCRCTHCSHVALT
jgi:integrase